MQITQHIFLDHCWICSDRASLHNHHIVPQAYGGVDGPQVTLCASCHNGVHHVADGREEMKPDYWNTEIRLRKAITLIRIIVDARKLSSGSENKQASVTIVMSSQLVKKLDELKASLGLSSRVSTIKTLIDLNHKRLTKR